MKYDLGIVGGLGPLASSLLYETITKNTNANVDQYHLNICLLSHASIPDRTAFILGKSVDNPYPYLLEDCKTLEKMGVKKISIPCNTSCYFHEKLQKEISVPINNIVKNTVEFVCKSGYKNVAIMATSGTIQSNLYQSELKKHNISYTLPNQEKVMEIIYDYVKKGKDVPKTLFDEIVNSLDVDAVILGCTELPVVKRKLRLDEKYIDPIEIETNNVLAFFDKL